MLMKILAASGVIVDDSGRVLLVLRANEPDAGCWTIPGGRVEADESLATTVAREVLEETGLAVHVHRELGTLEVPTGSGGTYEIHDFLATVVSGTLTPGDDAVDARWFTREEMQRLALTPDLLGYLTRYGVFAGGNDPRT
jgi:8-oxo-dGTP diphosphatase